MVRVRWLGQAFFLLTDAGGRRLAIDPFDPAAFDYPPAQVSADAVLVTHEHHDHNHVGAVAGEPRIVRGPGGVGEHDLGFASVRGVAAWHDEERGARRGPNTIYRVELGGLAFVHVGDLGHLLSAGQVTKLAPVDVLFVPLGGHFTLEPERVPALIESLGPRLTVGMHFGNRCTRRLPLAPVETFARGRKDVRAIPGPEFELEPAALPAGPEVWIPGLP